MILAPGIKWSDAFGGDSEAFAAALAPLMGEMPQGFGALSSEALGAVYWPLVMVYGDARLRYETPEVAQRALALRLCEVWPAVTQATAIYSGVSLEQAQGYLMGSRDTSSTATAASTTATSSESSQSDKSYQLPSAAGLAPADDYSDAGSDTSGSTSARSLGSSQNESTVRATDANDLMSRLAQALRWPGNPGVRMLIDGVASLFVQFDFGGYVSECWEDADGE